MRTISHSIDIDAAPAVVWGVLTDLARYGEWNPFISEITGDDPLATGARPRVRITPPGARAMTFRPRVTVVEPERRLEWLGRLGMPGVFDGRHSFTLTALPDGGTRLVQAETFTGVLVGLTGSTLERTSEGFRMMNEALAARCTAVGEPA